MEKILKESNKIISGRVNDSKQTRKILKFEKNG